MYCVLFHENGTCRIKGKYCKNILQNLYRFKQLPKVIFLSLKGNRKQLITLLTNQVQLSHEKQLFPRNKINVPLLLTGDIEIIWSMIHVVVSVRSLAVKQSFASSALYQVLWHVVSLFFQMLAFQVFLQKNIQFNELVYYIHSLKKNSQFEIYHFTVSIKNKDIIQFNTSMLLLSIENRHRPSLYYFVERAPRTPFRSVPPQIEPCVCVQ